MSDTTTSTVVGVAPDLGTSSRPTGAPVTRPDARPIEGARSPRAGRVRDRLPWTAALWHPVLLFAASRVVVGFAVALALAVDHGLNWHAALGEWDSGIWAGLAQHGYPSSPEPTVGSTLAFFPLYAVAIHVVTTVTGLSGVAAGVLVATGCGLAATVLLWLFTADLWDRRRADVATGLFVFSPGALAFSMAYSEGLMLLFAVPAVWAALRRRWVLAGLLAGVATAVRPNALGLVALMAVVAVHAVWRRRDWSALLAAVLSPLGAVAFVVYLKVHTGSWTAWPRAQSVGWFEKSNFRGLYLAAQSYAEGTFNPVATLVLVGAAMIAVGLVLMWRSGTPWQLVLFTVVALLPAMASQQVSTKPRMVLIAFPLFMAAGARLRGVGGQVAVTVMAGLTVALSTYVLAVPLCAP